MISKLGFIGGGKIVSALATGLIRAGTLQPQNIFVSEPCNKTRELIQRELKVETFSENAQIPRRSDTVIIAVKPDKVPKVLHEICPHLTSHQHLVISVAAGVNISTIQQHLTGMPVIRSMPNTSSQIGTGATLFSPGEVVNTAQIESVHTLFSTVGYCQRVEEKYLDVITGLSGCGPSYMYIVCEALADGGVKAGLPKELAVKLVAQTMLGASKMMLSSNKHLSQLKDDVCSPGGISINAVHTLERAGFRGILMDAVDVSSKKSLELAHSVNNIKK